MYFNCISSIQLSEEQLVDYLKNGRKQEAIQAFLGHVVNIATRYPYKQDYLIAEAAFALVKIINRIEKQINDGEIKEKYIGLIISTIKGACHTYLLKDNVFHKRFKPNRRPMIGNLIDLNGHTPTYNSSTQDLKEMAFVCAKAPVEEKILKLRLEGYNDKEIAKQLEMSNQDVGRVRAKIGERFLKLSKQEH